jgi:outer membrane lipoprotein-sorting protein
LATNAGFANGHVLRCTPKAPSNVFSTATYDVDGTTFQVRRVTLVDAQGNVNRFDFRQSAFGRSSSPASFHCPP